MKIQNKKVLNATPEEYDGISFKSKNEARSYQLLKEAGFEPKYEDLKVILLETLRPKNIKVYLPDKNSNLVQYEQAFKCITYSPDFSFDYKGYLIIFEVKGYANDVYPYKRKLFIDYMEKHDKKVIFFETKTQKNVKQAIEILKALDSNEN